MGQLYRAIGHLLLWAALSHHLLPLLVSTVTISFLPTCSDTPYVDVGVTSNNCPTTIVYALVSIE